MADSTTPAPRATSNRSTTPVSETFAQFIGSQWAQRPMVAASPREQSSFAAARRARISALYQGKRLIIPAGAAKTRSNDTDYPYRAHSAFAWLTGWGSDSVAGSVLVLEPTATGHDATLYFREAAGRDTDEFYANPEIGEFWTGPRPSLDHVAADLGLATSGLEALAGVLDATDAATLVVRDADRDLTDQLDGRRLLLSADTESLDTDDDSELGRDLSELRLVKDEFEIEELRTAVDVTKQGFDDVIGDLSAIVEHARGERLIEGTFNRRARAEGNTVGYDTIAASGPHA
ncbi:MAG: aminopeptidase P N-terminal domain-containing protein, partial [Rhodoglobus sp.]|nr:aminopeptidase P N-terminal domain-containing protein [Rhodoglobus sp.]